MCAKLLQSYQTLWDPMDCSPPGSSVSFDLIIKHRVIPWKSVFGLFAFSFNFNHWFFFFCQKHYLRQTSAFTGHSEHLSLLLKHRFWFSRSGMGIVIIISNNPSDDANTSTCPWTTVWLGKIWVLDLKYLKHRKMFLKYF